MSTVGTITKLATGVVGKAAHAVTHPRQTVSAVTGHARDLTASVTRADHKDVEPLEQSPTDAAVAPAEPAPPARSVEPSDDWRDEIEGGPDVGINPATGQPHSRQGDDEPLVDPSVAKSIRSEAETMRKASDPDR